MTTQDITHTSYVEQDPRLEKYYVSPSIAGTAFVLFDCLTGGSSGFAAIASGAFLCSAANYIVMSNAPKNKIDNWGKRMAQASAALGLAAAATLICQTAKPCIYEGLESSPYTLVSSCHLQPTP